jgi:hypothetical protein
MEEKYAKKGSRAKSVLLFGQAQIRACPNTVLSTDHREAPSGFGKTTAIREFLRENTSQGACEYW